MEQNTSPLISIVIPVYKVEKYLHISLDMILVDDGSPDKCGEICDEYANKDQRIKVIHKNNGGLSSARNAALDLPPKGDFVTFLDSDDFWHTDYLKSLVTLQEKYNADIVQCNHVRGADSSFPIVKESPMVDVLDNHKIFMKEKANIVMWGKLFRLRLFEGIRMPVGLYNEDDWTTWKLYYKAKTIVVTNQSLYYYTVNPSSIMGQLGKKPDLQYINAYNERIGFFVGTGEKDLEHCSRLQLCKSLLLTYRHSKLREDERQDIKAKFDESWKELKHSPYIKSKYKWLFMAFELAPLLTSKLANKLHGK